MKFSAQEEYGLRCLMTIAREGENGQTTIPEISRLEGITQPHAAKLLSILRRANLIKSTRGQTGGYTLNRKAEEIPVGEVLAVLGGKLYEGDFCLKHGGAADECIHTADCRLRPLWDRVQNAVDRVVYQISLKDLLDGKLEKDELIGISPISRRPRMK